MYIQDINIIYIILEYYYGLKNRILHNVCKYGDYNIIKMLIELDSKININIKDYYNRLPIHYASSGGYYNIVKILINNNTDVNSQDKQGVAPLHYACRNGYFNVVKILIENNADVNIQDIYKNTPLHWSTWVKNNDIINLLIHNKANINIKNKYNQTPFDIAIIRNFYKNNIYYKKIKEGQSPTSGT